jgi:hypothetical protein
MMPHDDDKDHCIPLQSMNDSSLHFRSLFSFRSLPLSNTQFYRRIHRASVNLVNIRVAMHVHDYVIVNFQRMLLKITSLELT